MIDNSVPAATFGVLELRYISNRENPVDLPISIAHGWKLRNALDQLRGSSFLFSQTIFERIEGSSSDPASAEHLVVKKIEIPFELKPLTSPPAFVGKRETIESLKKTATSFVHARSHMKISTSTMRVPIEAKCFRHSHVDSALALSAWDRAGDVLAVVLNTAAPSDVALLFLAQNPRQTEPLLHRVLLKKVT